jgi:type IV secretory pathway VirB10-like protein
MTTLFSQETSLSLIQKIFITSDTMGILVAILSFVFKLSSALVLLGSIALAVSEAARPLIDVPFDALLPEHFRGVAIYALGLLHASAAFILLPGRKTKAMGASETAATVEAQPTATPEETATPPPPMDPPPPVEPYPEETPRTLLKSVGVHTPQVMTIDDYEALKENNKQDDKTPGKSTTKRRKSIRTPKAVSRLSPS